MKKIGKGRVRIKKLWLMVIVVVICFLLSWFLMVLAKAEATDSAVAGARVIIGVNPCIEEDFVIENLPEEQIVEEYVGYATDSIYIRNAPSLQAEDIGYFNKGDNFVVIAEAGDWCRLKEEKKAYVNKNYVSLKPMVNEAEKQLLATALTCEAGGEGRDEMLLVGFVICNRRDTDYCEFADVNTIEEVLSQPGQYPVTWQKIQSGSWEPTEEALEVAEQLLDGTIDLDFVYHGSDILPRTTLWQTNVEPDWNAEVLFLSEGGHYYSALPSES